MDTHCARCAAVGRPGDRFCGRCGSPLLRKCPSCTAGVDLSAAACPNCAADLDPAGRGLPVAGTAPREERRVVTILFVDLTGFTNLGERLDPEDLRALQQRYFDTVARAIRRRGGVVEKYIGDAVMAVFGAPVTQEDDAVRAVRVGLELQADLDGRIIGPAGPLRARVGIATGEVVVDLDAIRDGGQALVAGDVVNVASRLQSHAPVGGIVVSSATWRASREYVEYAEMPPVMVKGKAGPVPVWRPLRLVQRRWDRHRDHGPFVGRGPYLDHLAGLLRATIDDRAPRMVTVVGPAGVGKSRLVRELNRHAEQAMPVGVRWVGGRCLAGGEGGPFAAIAEVVTGYAGVLESDSADTARRKVVDSLHGLLTTAERASVVDALAPLVGYAAPPVEADEAQAAWRMFFGRLAARRPLVVVIEDLALAEPPLLDFLRQLVDTVDGPLLVVATARPEILGHGRIPWYDATHPRHALVELPPLDPHDTLTLFRALSGDSPIPESALEHLTVLAAGTPLYAHEYVRMLADQRPDGDPEDPDDALPLPDSVRAVVASRVDLLGPRSQRALQAAAVIGEVFWPGAVATVAELARDEVEALLAELRAKAFIRPATGHVLAGEPALAFSHAVVRDLAYRRQPRALRVVRHQRAARWLQSHVTGRTTEAVDAVAHHRVAALELARTLHMDVRPFLQPARTALVAAAERAASLHAAPTAVDLLDKALALWDDSSTSVTLDDLAALEHPAARDDEVARLTALVLRWRLRFGTDADQFHATGGAAEVARCASQLEVLGARDAAASARTLLSQVAWARGDRTAALAHLDRALAPYGAGDESPVRAAAHAELARLRMMSYEVDEATTAAKTAGDLARRLGLPELEVNAQITEGAARYLAGDLSGLTLLERAVDRSRTDHLRSLRRASENLASALQEEGEIARSFALLDEAAATTLAYRGKPHPGHTPMRAYFDGDWDATLASADAAFTGDETLDAEWAHLRTLAAWLRALRGEDTGFNPELIVVTAARHGTRLALANALAHGALYRAVTGASEQATVALRRLEAEHAAEPLAPREWLAAAAHAAVLTGVRCGARAEESAGWLKGVLDAAPRETLWVRAARSVVNGGLAAHGGDHGTAALHHAVAASVYERMGDATDAALATAWSLRAARAGEVAPVPELTTRLTTFGLRNRARLLLRFATTGPLDTPTDSSEADEVPDDPGPLTDPKALTDQAPSSRPASIA
ncbi:adenylate/guanylate cyclase domain-containing protein [Cryptosporangium minutisporangium]|uniref:adenylate/guanylate cyclase domain-containing protein n=1 Tax=Cryptosporangium minutisporangium TaxID=113569 RepID=UPI0031E7E722